MYTVCQNFGLFVQSFGEVGSTGNEDSDKQKKHYSSILIVFQSFKKKS